MAQIKITYDRLLQIKRRQWEDRWGANYVASVFADPKEAPGISTGTILRPRKLGGREFHTLSRAETACALLALYNPQCWDLFEQRVMSPTPRSHLLFGHPKASGLPLAAFKGTLDVADRLGMLSTHPRVRLHVGADRSQWPLAPFPYLSDLNLCMSDHEGPYLLDWPVKDKFEDFRRRGPSNSSKARPDEDDPAVVQRNLLQKIYFEDAGVRSHHVVGRAIDFQVRCNLRELFLDDSHPLVVEDQTRTEITEQFRDSIGSDKPAYLLAFKVARDRKISERDVAVIVKQAIWRRELRVDLFQPVLMDRPLRAEREDVLDRYASWFKR
jgi:hypothetical protein